MRSVSVTAVEIPAAAGASLSACFFATIAVVSAPVSNATDNDEGGIALLNDANSRSMRIYVDASGNSVINSGDGGGATLKLNEGNGDVIVGHDLLPDADNDQDLGSSSKRWANIYTADLQLSNKGNTNDVDGTWGQYTIQEGEDDLFLINKRNGKKYKFMLEEVN